MSAKQNCRRCGESHVITQFRDKLAPNQHATLTLAMSPLARAASGMFLGKEDGCVQPEKRLPMAANRVVMFASCLLVFIVSALIPTGAVFLVRAVKIGLLPDALADVTKAISLFGLSVAGRAWMRRHRPYFAPAQQCADVGIAGGVLNCIGNALNMPYYKPGPVLDDVGFNWLPEILPGTLLYSAGDILIVGSLLSFLAYHVAKDTPSVTYEKRLLNILRCVDVRSTSSIAWRACFSSRTCLRRHSGACPSGWRSWPP